MSIKIKQALPFLVASSLLAITMTSREVQATSTSLQTKIAGNKTYNIYKKVSKKGVKHKVTTTSPFKYAHLQSRSYVRTKHGTYWYLYANGRGLGWVNQNFFARNKINVVKSVSLVKNSADRGYNTADAVNYVTDRTGSVVDLYKVWISQPTVSSATAGTTRVLYQYNGRSAESHVTVRSNSKEGIAKPIAAAQTNVGPTSTTWVKRTGGSFKIQKKAHTYVGTSGMTLKTVFFQPNILSLAGSPDTQVGLIPEGMTYADGWMTTSLYSTSNNANQPFAWGHLASYRLSAFDSKFDAQYIPTDDLSFSKFKKYSENIKVSPYIRLGHGQAIGSTTQYIYVVANYNKAGNPRWSNEILRIRKSDMLIDKIWTFKVAASKAKYPRYFHNVTVVDDFTMIGLFHNSKKHKYEFWKISRLGDSFTASQIGQTANDLITNSAQVQGFTYDQANRVFYIAFNDHIFKLAEDGSFISMNKFNTKREFEGIAIKNGQLIVNMAQRAELMQANN